MTYFASDFQDLDNSHNVQNFVQCLELQQSLDLYKYYKQKTFEKMQLKPGDSVLEVGCGTGNDALLLTNYLGEMGKVTAVDRSQSMLNQARENTKNASSPLEFVLANAETLPFANNTFNSARVDRTLQHIPHPQTAIAEMARVVKSNGWVVAFEPDWGTLVINSDNRTTTRQVVNFWCDNFPSGWVGRYLSRYCSQAGLTDVTVEPITISFTQLELADKVLDISRSVEKMGEQGIANQESLDHWLTALKQGDEAGQFFCAFTAFLVSGKKASNSQILAF
jgi:ubiquinone/menaquinone biosynthesis C-methylase UbiE